jgi:2-polyprenyl-3-methyl-5-hydroxy-6-metoxy-1,4-benzoquinol methylase
LIREILRKAFPLWRTARKLRPPHYHLFPAPPPSPLEDLPDDQIASINALSGHYFERAENREFWLNKPFSDPVTAGWYLWRFGQLLCGVKPRPGDRILDFGCGTGWTSAMLARMGAEVVGMDIAEEALNIARKNIPPGTSLTFEGYDGKHIPAQEGAFDLIILFEAFHHLPNPRRMLNEFFRVLAPNGILGFAEPGVGHSLSESSMAETEHGILEHDVDLEQLYSSALKAGFIDMELFVPAIHPHTFPLSMQRARWFLRGISAMLPANVHRLALLSSPIGVLYKGPYRVTSRHPRSHEAIIKPHLGFYETGVRSQFSIAVKIKNPSETVWLKEAPGGVGYVRVGAHLLNEQGAMLNYDYGREPLPADLKQRQSAEVKITLTAPEAAGNYIVRLDAVNEGICWFEQEGTKPVDVRLRVL